MSVVAAVFGTRFSFGWSAARTLAGRGELRTFSIAAAKRSKVVRSHRNRPELCGLWEKENAIFARLYRAVHQSAMRSPRPLAPRRCHRSLWRRRPLPLLRRFPSQRSPAARPALPHAPPLPHRPPAVAPAAPLANEPARTSAFLNHGNSAAFGPCQSFP